MNATLLPPRDRSRSAGFSSPSCSAEEDVAYYFRLSAARESSGAGPRFARLPALPRFLWRRGAEPSPAAPAAAAPAPFKVLLVDDHPDSVEAIVRMFRRTGCQADCVESAAAALSLLETDKPAVVLLDVMMPDMDGVELLKAIRRRVGCEKLPVVMLSADPRRAREALSLGAQDYILKPADWTRLRARVDKYLR